MRERDDSGAVDIDGSRGEGGGQILRTSLALAALTGRPVRFRRIRAGRPRPGLARQHLACVQAAAAICDGDARGAEVGAQTVDFTPGALRGGDWTFRIGTAGSCGLVLQTVLPALLAAPGPSRVTIVGGTHNGMAPPFDFLAEAFVPVLRRMGAAVTLTLTRHGFEPAGGGELVCTIEPGPLRAIELVDASPVRRLTARALVAGGVPRDVAARELATARRELPGLAEDACAIEEVAADGGGNALVLAAARDDVTEVVTGFGRRGVRAEQVAARAAAELRAYLDGGAPVGEHLADQLMLPMALAQGRSRYRTATLSRHATTNRDTIRLFLDVPIEARVDAAGATIAIG
ncbi:MAG: RNA 3'-terminal phosphate cyclase [Kofleriaceae bacterium]|nr:RNA 3'-terminal phosphate cyclase [Kofleriaceae bacterium]